MLLIGCAVGFMSGVLLMFFLLGLRAPGQVVELAGTLVTHNPAQAQTRSAEAFLRVRGSQA